MEYIVIAFLIILLLAILFCLYYKKNPRTFEAEIQDRLKKIDEDIIKDRKKTDEEREKFEVTTNRLLKNNDAILKKMHENLQ